LPGLFTCRAVRRGGRGRSLLSTEFDIANKQLYQKQKNIPAKFPLPDKIPLLQRVQTIKILGVTFTSSVSVTLHVQSFIAAWAQTLYALRVLRKHGLCDDSLHDIFHAVAVAKLMYASNAWWGFSNANDRQKISAFIRRCNRTGFCSPDLADFHDLYISSDEKSFNKIVT